MADILDLHGELNTLSVEQIRRELMEDRTVILTSAMETRGCFIRMSVFSGESERF
jgi:hypothetical protein